MKVKIRSCCTMILLVIIGIVFCFIDWPEIDTYGMENYNTAVKKYEQTGVSLRKVERAYSKLSYEEKQKLKKK